MASLHWAHTRCVPQLCVSASHTDEALAATLTIGCCVSITGCTDTQQPIGTCCRRWMMFVQLRINFFLYKWMTVLIGWLRPDLRQGRNDLAILSQDDYCVQMCERHKMWRSLNVQWSVIRGNDSGLLCVVTIKFFFVSFFVWVSPWWWNTSPGHNKVKLEMVNCIFIHSCKHFYGLLLVFWFDHKWSLMDCRLFFFFFK